MAFTISRPACEFTVMHYQRGASDAWYIAITDALRKAKNNYHTLTIYRWSDGNKFYQDYNAATNRIDYYEWKNVPADIKELLHQQNSALFDQFRPVPPKQAAVKSEPAPDDYYIIINENWDFQRKETLRAWLVLRKDYKPESEIYNFDYWDIRNNRKTYFNTCSRPPQKFPQLSSEIKAELQKQNPERYKEWEEFYMNKYPGFKPLNPASNFSHIKPDEVYFISYKSIVGNDFACFIDIKVYNNFINSNGTNENATYWKNLSKAYLGSGSNSDRLTQLWPDISTAYKTTLKQQNPELYQYFEQYYIQLEQKKVVEKQLYKRPNPMIPSNIMILSTAEKDTVGWAFIDAGLYNSLGPDDKYSAAVWKDPNKFTTLRAKKETNTAYLLSKICEGTLLVLQQSNPILYSSIFGKTMHNLVGISTDRGKEAHTVIFEENGPFPKDTVGLSIGKDSLTGQFLMGWDPYQADYETQGVISIWNRDSTGRIINRLTAEKWIKDSADWFVNNRTSPLEFEREIMNHAKYYGQINLKARRVGQTIADAEWVKMAKTLDSLPGFIQTNQQNYTPNLKQQNNEIINVSRKTITISSGEKCTGNPVSSIRRAPAVTEKHTGDRTQPIRGKEGVRCCKIG